MNSHVPSQTPHADQAPDHPPHHAKANPPTRRIRRWLRHHKVEIILAVIFAVPFAFLAERLVGVHEHDPYKIHVVESTDTDKETKELFDDLANHSPLRVQSMGDVPVKLEVSILPNDDIATAQKLAADLATAPDTLMIIGHLPSGITEAILPIVMKERPQIPYISTSASADELLANCDPKDVAVNGFVPLIQPSPRNCDEAAAAVKYALQEKKQRFLLVTDKPPEKDPYLASLSSAWEKEIVKGHASVVGNHAMDLPLSDEQLKNWNPDCILYAGGVGVAQTLMNSLASSESLAKALMASEVKLLAIFADSVIESRDKDTNLISLSTAPRGKVTNLNGLTDLRFTYAANADDYNVHDNEYAQDALRIATQLIADLSERGGDLRYRLRSLLHLETVKDARRNLIQIMAQNAHLRSWYECNGGEPCVFTKFYGSEGMFHSRRINGMFHVWEADSGTAKMKDVDYWHPPKSALLYASAIK